jgi:hypothetical protein
MTGSNRRPPACKAGALPAELIPHYRVKTCAGNLVGLVGFEPTTPALSRRCSNQLSYRPGNPRVGCSHCELITYSVTRPSSLPLLLETADRLWTRSNCDSRKEVIQPHLPIRLPCYDFTPVMNLTVATAPLTVRLASSGETHSHGVTGGVYKTRERIHRGMLIRDY